MKFFAVVAFVAIFGLAAADLQSDLHEFAELIPVAEIREVAKRYIATDAEVQQALKYLQGDEWAALVTAVREHPTWISFKDYLNDAGIDIEAIIDYLHDLIANAGQKSVNVHGSRSMREFIDEIQDLIPTAELFALLGDKVSNSPDFQEFWVKISSEKAYKMVEEIRALPEVQRVADVLEGMGLDITGTLELIYGLLGWPF